MTGERAYVASRDSTAFALGDSVNFELRGKGIAGGMVSSMGQGEMATVAISSGSLRERELARVRVVTRHAAVPAAHLLRLGYPAADRPTPFLACPGVVFGARGYRYAGGSDGRHWLVRDSTVVMEAPWPDTLEIQTFREVVDEEIALERGQIDLGVFWPGELSPSMRANPRWQGSPSGIWGRRMVALSREGVDTLDSRRGFDVEAGTLSTLNRDLFRGDLMPLWNRGPNATAEATVERLPARIEVELNDPGRGAIERYLGRHATTARSPVSGEKLRLTILDVPWDPLGRAWVEWLRGGALTPDLGQNFRDDRVVPLFAIRCPVVCSPELRAAVKAMGPDALVDLLFCGPPRFQP